MKNSWEEIDSVIDKEFDEVVDMSKVDTSVSTYYDWGVYSFNYACSKNLKGGIPKGRITGIDGLSGVGKSLLVATAMRDPNIDYILIIESEGGGNSDELLKFAGVDPKKVRLFKAATLNSYKIKKKDGTIEEVSDNALPKKRETPDYKYVEGAGSLIRRFCQKINFNGIKSNIFIVMDSLGNMASTRTVAGGHDMGKRGQEFTNFFKSFDNEFEKSGMAFVFTNKLYQTMSLNGPTHVQSGGESPIYNSSLYVRLSTTSDSDDITETDKKKEIERKTSALGASMKTIRASIIKSRFGTERRQVPFLLDFSVGPVRMSGLFRLLKDFDVIKKSGGAFYYFPELTDVKFMKKDFINKVIEFGEEKAIDMFQELLDKREREVKEERTGIQVNDFEEYEEKEEEDEGDEFASSGDEMVSAMIKQKES